MGECEQQAMAATTTHMTYPGRKNFDSQNRQNLGRQTMRARRSLTGSFTKGKGKGYGQAVAPAVVTYSAIHKCWTEIAADPEVEAENETWVVMTMRNLMKQLPVELRYVQTFESEAIAN